MIYKDTKIKRTFLFFFALYYSRKTAFSIIYRYFIDNRGPTIIKMHVTKIPQLSITHNTCFWRGKTTVFAAIPFKTSDIFKFRAPLS